MMALGTIYPIGLVVEGAIAGAVGIRDVTVASGALLLAVMAGMVTVRPGWFQALDDDHVGTAAGESLPVPAAGRRHVTVVQARFGDAVSHPALSTLAPGPAEEAQRRVAGALAAAGLGPGDRVAFCLPSSAALLLCVLGALRRGIVPVLLNATLLPGERDVLMADAEPSLTVSDRAPAWPLCSRADRPSWRPFRWPVPCTTRRARRGEPKECGPGYSTRTRPVDCSRTKPTSGLSTPPTPTWSARRCTTRCRSASRRGPCCGEGGW